MKLRCLYKKVKPEKYKLKISYDKKSKGRPAWVKIEGLPDGISYISVLLDEKSEKKRQTYCIYIEKGLFLPIDYTKKEMEIFYNKFSEGYDKEIRKKNMRAIDFFVKRVKKHIKRGEMLDLGAGTGLVTEKFVKQGFSPAQHCSLQYFLMLRRGVNLLLAIC